MKPLQRLASLALARALPAMALAMVVACGASTESSRPAAAPGDWNL